MLTVPTIMAIIGGIALLAGLFGGGLELKEIRIPPIPLSSRIISSLTGLVSIAFAIWLSFPNLIQRPTETSQPIAYVSATSPVPPTQTTAPPVVTATQEPPTSTSAPQPTDTSSKSPSKPQPTSTPSSFASPIPTPKPVRKLKVGQVTDTGGIDDKTFNATAWKGVQDAIDKLGIQGRYLESEQQTDYAKNITEFLQQKYDLIVTVGFLLGEDTAKFAKENPNTKFTIVDYAYDPVIPNVLGLTFSTDQAAFLAGYLAAGMSKTGKVGTFGGMEIPTVTIFMVGYANGVALYNMAHGTNVEVLGTKFYVGNFNSTDDGRRAGESLMDEGADIIMPVAGKVGLGTAAAVKERGKMLIGVDTDMVVSASEYKDIILTSVLKNMDVAVFEAIKQVEDGTFKGGTYAGTLANNGVGLADFHEFKDKVPQALKDELEQLRKDLIGKMTAG